MTTRKEAEIELSPSCFCPGADRRMGILSGPTEEQNVRSCFTIILTVTRLFSV